MLTITRSPPNSPIQQAQDKLVRRAGAADGESARNYPTEIQPELPGGCNRSWKDRETASKISRRDYNAAVQEYNTELVTVPGSLWAARSTAPTNRRRPSPASTAAQSARW